MLRPLPPTLCVATLLATTAAAVATTSAFGSAPKDSAAKGKNPGVSLKASLNYVDGSDGEIPAYGDIKVTIVRDGEQLATKQDLPKGSSTSYYARPKLVAVDLDDDDEPEVVVNVFTASTDRERRTIVLRKSGQRYVADVDDWGTGGYRLSDVVGGESPEFVASDSRVPALFGSTARGPLRVMAYDHGKLSDVSRKARPELLRDAKRHRRALSRARRGGADRRPAVAAYAIDLVRLGRTSTALATIRGAARKKELRGTARAFARKLDRAMVRWGYAKRKVLERGL